MNREIKFRAWDKNISKMRHFDSCKTGVLFSGGEVAISSGWDSYDNPTFEGDSNFVLMQYTGLKDKNGVDIYEGDIVNTYNCKSCCEVIYRNACFCIKSPKGGISELYDLAPVSNQAMEVIGNSFQNPELLEGK